MSTSTHDPCNRNRWIPNPLPHVWHSARYLSIAQAKALAAKRTSDINPPIGGPRTHRQYLYSVFLGDWGAEGIYSQPHGQCRPPTRAELFAHAAERYPDHPDEVLTIIF